VATVLLAAPGCTKVLGIEDFTLTPDADIDAPSPDAQLCYGAGLAPICVTNAPTGTMTLDAPIDTTACPGEVVAQTGGPELCVIAATQISVSASVTVTGGRPLMLLATETISVPGSLDVSSRRVGARIGAGANFTGCGAGTAPLNTTNGAGGGAGGSFVATGARGGDGAPAGVVVNNNGVAPTGMPLTFVRGGCKAQDGGDSGANQGGVGGASGGAVYLFACTSIDVQGSIFASGAGGSASALHAGGGGGGAGGLIGLEAPTINVTGILAANGANGSGGSGSTAGGAAGADGATTAFSTQAAAASGGATGGGGGGRGFTGVALQTIGGTGSTAVAGTAGGGGGGVAGVIYVKGTLTGTQVSPAPTVSP
jgi:hypothetical protein